MQGTSFQFPYQFYNQFPNQFSNQFPYQLIPGTPYQMMPGIPGTSYQMMAGIPGTPGPQYDPMFDKNFSKKVIKNRRRYLSENYKKNSILKNSNKKIIRKKSYSDSLANYLRLRLSKT